MSVTGNRHSPEMREWKKKVLERDNAECTKCGSKENLAIHHIKPYAEYVELRTDVNNGTTLCGTCHRYIHMSSKVKTRLAFDVDPEVKEMLKEIIKGTDQTITGFIREAVESAYESKFGEENK